MRSKSIKFSVILSMVIIITLSVFSGIGIYQGRIVSDTDLRYHRLLGLENELSHIIGVEINAVRSAKTYDDVIEKYTALQQKASRLTDPAILKHLAQRQHAFRTLFINVNEIAQQYEAVRRHLPEMITSVRYIHEHHLAYLKNLMRR
jgi:hypothetical protein